jgi:serine/threonine protein kinase
MPRKSESLRLLERLDVADLRRFAQHHEIPHTGAGAQLRRRLIGELGTTIEGVVSLRGPWSRENWNALVQRMGGQPSLSFEELRHEIRRLLADPNDDTGTSTPGPGSVTSDRVSTTDPHSVPPPQWSLPQVGTIIDGRYRLRERLGAGGFGTVFAARDEDTGDDGLVLKFANDPAHADSVLNEYRKATVLNHPNICSYKHYQRTPEFGPFVVMRNGGTSVATLAKNAGLGVLKALEILRQAAVALDFAHSRDVIHGDVSPGNLLVDAVGRVQITDFGIATTATRVLQQDGRFTVIGTSVKGYHRLFGAPETLHLILKRESDQYSLALVFVAMIKGMHRFQGPESAVDGLVPTQERALARAQSSAFASRFRTCVQFADAMQADARAIAG